MRALYSMIIIILISIQPHIGAMQAAACAAKSAQPNSLTTFGDALVRVGKEAEAKRLAQSGEKEKQETEGAPMDATRVYVPARIIALGIHAPSIKQAFSAMPGGKNNRGISDLILDYTSDWYEQYQDLFYSEQDAYGRMKAFYPCVALVFDKDGVHIHAQLNARNTNNDHQLVHWSLYSGIIRSNQIQDYDFGPKDSNNQQLDLEVRERYLWWQAYTKNIFNNNGDFAPASTLKVVLQYNVAQIIKAMLMMD